MRFSVASPRLSLKARLIWSYLVILGTGGLATSLVGSWIVSSTIMMQARRAVDHDFATARTAYEQQLQALKLAAQFAASGTTIQGYLAAGDRASVVAYLERIRRDAGFDFLGLTDAKGRVVLRVARPGPAGDDVSSIGVVGAALSGQVASATEILSAAALARENPELPGRARLRTDGGEETAGMALVTAAPVGSPPAGALYGGVLLTGNFAIVDRVWNLLFRGDRFDGVDSGSVTIFMNDLGISTNVQTARGERAVGAKAPAEVRDAVLKRGAIWRGRAFIVKDWYISEYAPIRNYAGDAVGMLSSEFWRTLIRPSGTG